MASSNGAENPEGDGYFEEMLLVKEMAPHGWCAKLREAQHVLEESGFAVSGKVVGALALNKDDVVVQRVKTVSAEDCKKRRQS